MHVVGIRELKNRLTYFLGLAREGDAIIVTDRREPVAVIRSLKRAGKKSGPEEKLASLAKRRYLRIPAARTPFRPLAKPPARGKDASEIIIGERR